jgi:hypothetical protein
VSTVILLLLMSPLLLLVLMFSLVGDRCAVPGQAGRLPAVLRECGSIFRRLIDRVPSPRNLPNLSRGAGADLHNGQIDGSTGEAR